MSELQGIRENIGLTENAKEYLQSQLEYDHTVYEHPCNTKVVLQKQHEFISRAVKSFAISSKVFFLDIGCGWGDFSEKLDPYITDYIGIEPSLVELQRFRKKGGRYLVRGVGEYLDFLQDNSRSVILLNSVLDHCVDPLKTFENCKRVLAPGGLLIISMENFHKIPIQLRKSFGFSVEHEGHMSAWSYDDVYKLLSGDFEITTALTFGYLFGFHQLTKFLRLPEGLLHTLNVFTDALFTRLAKKGGQILFFVATKKGKLEKDIATASPFRCPACLKGVQSEVQKCSNCGFVFSYETGGILNMVETGKKLNNTLFA